MTNDTFLDEAYDYDPDEDLNDGLDSCYPGSRRNSNPQDSGSEDSEPYYKSSYSQPYGSYGPYYPRPWDNRGQKTETSITKNLLDALLTSHSREISLLKQMIKNSTISDKK